jgi:GNAT superfamily N-acetyltransferase
LSATTVPGCESARSEATTPRVSWRCTRGVQTIYQRFFKRLPADWAYRLATVDHVGREALVVEHGPAEDPVLIAVGRYEPTGDPKMVEVAFVVEDRWQGKGIGTALFRDLLRVADAHGIRRFRAFVLADNPRMVDLIARFATVRSRSLDHGVLTLDFVPS